MVQDSDDRRTHLARQAQRWRLLSMGGGLLLAASFFMPAVKGCNAPVIPASEARDIVSSPCLNWLPAFYFYVAAYLFGLLVAIAAMTRLSRRQRLEQYPVLGLLLILLLGCVVMPAAFVYQLVDNASGSKSLDVISVLKELAGAPGMAAVILVCPGASMVYLWFMRRRSGDHWMGVVFCGTTWSAVWFSLWLFGNAWNDVYHGLVCSWTGAMIVLVSLVGEASVAGSCSLIRAVGRLAIARVPPYWTPGCCRICGYSLQGLRDPRCPECGTNFEWSDQGFAPPPTDPASVSNSA